MKEGFTKNTGFRTLWTAESLGTFRFLEALPREPCKLCSHEKGGPS